MNARNRQPIAIILVMVVLIALLMIGRTRFRADNQRSTRAGTEIGFKELDRHPKELIFTKHARCRMDCREIDESEVREIIENGAINDNKSDPSHKPDPTFALEGMTHDRQHVRLIVAPSNNKLVVITCIDLDHEWSCDCDH